MPRRSTASEKGVQKGKRDPTTAWLVSPEKEVNQAMVEPLSCAKPHRQAQPLQTEAGNAKKALETAIPGVLRIRPAPIDSVRGPVRFSSARTTLPVSSVPLSFPSAL